MMDSNYNTVKMMIAAGIYLMVVLIVAAGLTLRGANFAAENEASGPASLQQAGLHASGNTGPATETNSSSRPADKGRFDGIEAGKLLAPAVQAIIRSKPRTVF